MESKHRVWSSKTHSEPDYKKRNYSQDCFGQASTAPPCSCLRSWVSHMLITSVLVHTAGEPPSTWAGDLWEETKPEDTYQLLRKAQSAPELPIAAERTFTSGHFLLLCHAGRGAELWRHHPMVSPEVQLNSFSFTLSAENDALENMCQKDSME